MLIWFNVWLQNKKIAWAHKQTQKNKNIFITSLGQHIRCDINISRGSRHNYGNYLWTCFSPVCSRMWTFMLPEVEKHFKQHWHSKALMPVWVFICAVSVLLTANALKHCLHLKGFSCVWMRMWRTRSLGFLNSLEQYGQPCHRTPFSSLMEPGTQVTGADLRF